MPITGDLLAAATPTRLVCRRGSWVLEVERLVSIERNVYQPRTQRLEGSEAILQHLQRSADNPARQRGQRLDSRPASEPRNCLRGGRK
jgi:hypothetical protein